MNPQFVAKIELLPVLLPVFVVAMVLHELAHAYVAKLLGDTTAKELGRLTLNPAKHLDPIGSATFAVTYLFMPFVFGWARPVPVHTSNLRSPKRDMALVAIAGPLTNFLIALVLFAAFVDVEQGAVAIASEYWSNVIGTAITVNVVLGVFNLIPIPPLDGSRVLGALLPDHLHRRWAQLDQYGPPLLMLLVFTSAPPFTQFLATGQEVVYRLMVHLVG